jgi:predicted nuclease of predicted toxin-antitoxin system
MKFLIDAPLPRRLAIQLSKAGFDVVHTFDLPLGNRTQDPEINKRSIAEERVVVTKDSDFVDTIILNQQPWKLLLVSTGNIRNSELEHLFSINLERMVKGFETFDFIEVNRSTVIFHF